MSEANSKSAEDRAKALLLFVLKLDEDSYAQSHASEDTRHPGDDYRNNSSFQELMTNGFDVTNESREFSTSRPFLNETSIKGSISEAPKSRVSLSNTPKTSGFMFETNNSTVPLTQTPISGGQISQTSISKSRSSETNREPTMNTPISMRPLFETSKSTVPLSQTPISGGQISQTSISSGLISQTPTPKSGGSISRSYNSKLSITQSPISSGHGNGESYVSNLDRFKGKKGKSFPAPSPYVWRNYSQRNSNARRYGYFRSYDENPNFFRLVTNKKPNTRPLDLLRPAFVEPAAAKSKARLKYISLSEDSKPPFLGFIRPRNGVFISDPLKRHESIKYSDSEDYNSDALNNSTYLSDASEKAVNDHYVEDGFVVADDELSKSLCSLNATEKTNRYKKNQTRSISLGVHYNLDSLFPHDKALFESARCVDMTYTMAENPPPPKPSFQQKICPVQKNSHLRKTVLCELQDLLYQQPVDYSKFIERCEQRTIYVRSVHENGILMCKKLCGQINAKLELIRKNKTNFEADRILGQVSQMLK